MHRAALLSRRSWQSLSTRFHSSLAITNVTKPAHLFGMGSSSRFLSSSSNHPVAPLNTDWASPSEDDIHVSDIPDNGQMAFSSFPLAQKVLDKLRAMGCETTFEIQGKTIPLLLEGKDVIGRAVTGSGKTLAFALPVVHTLLQSQRTRNPRALIITPTRELCNQVHSCIQSLDHSIRCVALYGGAGYASQESALRRGVDVIVATPGRLNDHLERGNFGLNDIKFLVLDEADELLTPNFKMQIERILEDSPEDKQVMLFSATMPPDIRSVTKRYMRNAEMVDLVTNRSMVPDSIIHEACQVRHSHKMNIVPDLIQSNQPKRALIFMPMKVQTHELGSRLSKMGFKAGVLNSDMSQRSREIVIQSFRDGSVEVLVATDVAARGLDIPDIELVIHVGIPPNGVEFYIHRSGRTGRKGQPGKTILVYSDRDPQAFGFLDDLRRNKIKLNYIQPPSGAKIAELALKNAVSKLNPESFAAELMDKARPYAQELTDQHGSTDALAAALVSISNIDSRGEGWGDTDGNFGRRPRRDFQDRDATWGRGGGRGGGRGTWDRYGTRDRSDNRRGGGGFYRGGGGGGGGGFRGRDRHQHGDDDNWRNSRRRTRPSYDDEFMDDASQPWEEQQNKGPGGKKQDPFAWDD